MLLWLDDARQAPPGWTWAKTARQAFRALATGRVTYASFDCDLVSPTENGVWLVQQMIRFKLWPEYKPGVHSSNWEKAKEMLYLIRQHGPYDEYALYNGSTKTGRRTR